MTTYKDALKKLQHIYDECNPDNIAQVKSLGKKDEFSRMRRQLNQDIRQTRILLKERDELHASRTGAKDAAEYSYKIRNRIKQMKEDAKKFQNIQRQEQKKFGSSFNLLGSNNSLKQSDRNSKALSNEEKRELVELVFSHIEELAALESKRNVDLLNSERAQLFAGQSSYSNSKSIGINMQDLSPNAKGKAKAANISSSLPEIYDEEYDPAISEGLIQLKQRDQAIDENLDQIRTGVGQLHEIALNMDQEIQKQNVIIDSIDRKVDIATEQMENINHKLKKAVNEVMVGDKFLVNCILITIILCIVGFVASYYSN